MGQKIIILALALLWAAPVLAQLYENKYENMVVPMEHAIKNSTDYTANVRSPGAIEDDKPDAQRYEENVGTMDKVTDKHFDAVDDMTSTDKNETKP